MNRRTNSSTPHDTTSTTNLNSTTKPLSVRRRRATGGLGQLTLVEHALCPLDAKSSLAEGKIFEAEYLFCDTNRHMQSAHARIFCPLGLSAGDEFFLWGLLGITLATKDADHEFHATPHYCLRQLGLIDQHARRGGRQYQQFTDAIERLSAVRYQSDCFYDPVRAEHRKVSFGFLSYSLPLDPQSSRAWRIVWDPIFFEFVKAAGGYLWFDLDTYRALDPASRRLFLFLSKVLSRRRQTLRLGLRHVGVNILGFSATLETKDLTLKVKRCIQRLTELDVVAPPGATIDKLAPGDYRLTVNRGNYFDRRSPSAATATVKESPLAEPLTAIGLDEASISRLQRQYPDRLLREWADITLAAKERYGPGFFKRSPQAFFVDNVKHAAQGNRTPPDWWHDLRKAEERAQAPLPLAKLQAAFVGKNLEPAGSDHTPAAADSNRRFDSLRQELAGQLVAEGTPKAVARQRATQIARAQVRNQRPTTRQSLEPIKDLLQKFTSA